MRFLQVTLLTSVLLSGVACTQDPQEKSLPYTVLDDQASQLRADFNRKVGTVRLLFVVDPICPGCLRGLDDMNRNLLRDTADPRLQVFVVHEPVLGVARFVPRLRSAGGSDVPKAAKLLQNPNVKHYWNPSGAFGRLLSKSVGLKNDAGPVYAWDVWLLYGPDARWTAAGPPPPQLLMQQLHALRDTQFPALDAQVFADQARTLLSQQAPIAATAAHAN